MNRIIKFLLATFKFLLAIALIALIPYLWWRYPEFLSWKTQINAKEIDKLGQNGDAYGSLNAIFSGVAMIVAFFTLYLSSKERKSKQTEEHIFQNFDMVKEIIDGIRLFEGDIEYKIGQKKYLLKVPADVSGRLAFVILRDNFKLEKIDSHPAGNLGKYEDFYKSYLHRLLGHYFRGIYHAIKYIDKSELSRKQKIFYTHMLRAQISSDELFFLFYSGISKFGRNKFKPLIEKYSLFEHLHNEIVSTDLIQYNKLAYGNNSELLIEYEKQLENQKNIQNSK